MQISQISLILTEKKTNGMLTIKLSFCYYTIKLIECMVAFIALFNSFFFLFMIGNYNDVINLPCEQSTTNEINLFVSPSLRMPRGIKLYL